MAEKKMTICEKCGAKDYDGKKICPNCGSKMEEV